MMRWLSEWWAGGLAVVETASSRDARRLAQLHGESFHRGWGEGEFESMLSERNTLVHRLKVGRKIGSLSGRRGFGLDVLAIAAIERAANAASQSQSASLCMVGDSAAQSGSVRRPSSLSWKCGL